MRSTIAILYVSLACIACQPRSVQSTPIPRDEGTLFVYLRPFPREANRLTFGFRTLTAVREDGLTVPLALHIDRAAGDGLDRERLLASGALAPGRYVGFSLQVEGASLAGEGGRSALSIPDEPARIDLSFTVVKRRGNVAYLGFRYADSVVDGFAFRPVFDGELPGELATGRIAVATSRAFHTATIFDKVSGRVAGIVPTGRRPAGLVLAEARGRAYIAVSGEDSVEVIDLVQKVIIDRVRLRGGDAPQELALTPDGRLLLSANAGSDSVSFIDPEALFEVDRVSVGNGPESILVDAAGQRAYVFNARGNSISILDLPGRAVIGAIQTDAEPLRGDFDPQGERFYVIHGSSPYMIVIDPITLATLDRIYVGAGAVALKVDDATGWIYLARRGGASVEIYEPGSFLPVGSVPAPGQVVYVTIDGEGNNLFFVLREARGVRSVSLAGQRTSALVDLGGVPYRVAMMGER